MADKKGYDTTLARIAGNIASGLVSRGGHGTDEELAQVAINLAHIIVNKLRTDRPDRLVMDEIERLEADCRCGNLALTDIGPAVRRAFGQEEGL